MLEAVVPADMRRSTLSGEGHASVSIRLDTIDARALLPTDTRHDRSLWAAVAIAVLAHAGLIVALLPSVENHVGAQGTDLDAISVEVAVVTATALESHLARAEKSGSVAAPMEITEGAQTQPATDAPIATKPEDEREAEVLPDNSVDPQALQRAVPPEADRMESDQPPVENPVQPKPYEPLPPPSPPVGGIATRAAEDNGAMVRGAAVASPGDVQRYAKHVVEALSRSRPRGVTGSARGTVTVSFAIAEDGALLFVRIAASSGSAQLDDAALAAVRRITLPPPPVGMSPTQLTYEIPYQFK